MSNKAFNARHGISVGTTPTDVIDNTGEVLTNAASATKLKTARTIQLSGDVAGSASFDGTADINITATVQPNSVALGTDTTGNYMVDVSAGTGVTVSHTQSEGSTATVSIGQAVASTDSPTFANLTLTGELRGPANFVIDPAAVGDNTGTVVIKGNLQIDGTTTTVNSTTTTVDDTVITLGGDTAPTTDDTFDRGVDFRWYDTQARLGFFGFDRSTGKFTFIPQSTLASGVYSGTKGEVDAYLDWSNVLNKPTIDNTTYSHLAVTTTGGAFLRLTASGGGTDDVKFASGTNATVAYTNDDTITISSSDTTYSVKASTQTGGAGLDLDAGGSGSGTDTVKFLGSGGTTVARTDADTITVSSTVVNDGTLSASAATAGSTNTTIALNFSGAYSANTANNRTINPVVGPAITALATTMTGATTGFLKKTGADTYTLDTNTYLTSAGDGALSVAARSAGATNTDVTLELSGAYSANTATDRTIKAVVGPSLTALATLMTGATTGFVKKTGADTYTLDTNTYLTSYTDTNTTYTLDGQTTATNDVDIQLIAGGSGSGTDSIKFVGAGATTVAWDEANQKVTVTSTDTQPNDGTLSVAAKSAGATNTDVTLELSGAYSANTSNNRTIKAVVGPALTALATLMATAGPGFIRRTATADTFAVDTNTYLTSYTETDTLSSVTGRGASTSTNITLSGGTTYLGSASTNYITTSDNGSIIVRTKDQTTRQSSLLNLQTGNSTLAGSNSGSILIKTGNATGGSDAFAGDISMYPGTSHGQGAIVLINGGESYGGTTSSGGYVTIKGGDSTTTSGTTTANGGNVYIYGGSITSANNFTKNTGSIYMDGGGASGSGTITYGTINIGRTSGSSSYGTSAVNIGNSLITTTINGTVKLPEVGTSGFVKLGAGGQLSADTNTYALSSHTHSYLSAEADTLATVTGRGNSTSNNFGSSGGTNLNFVTSGNTGTWIGGISDGTSGWALSRAVIGFKSDDTTYAAIGIGSSNGLLYFGRTGTGGAGTMSSWLEVNSSGVANFKLARPQYNGSNLALVSEIPSVSGYLTAESDTLATVTSRGNTANGAICVPAGESSAYGFWGGTGTYGISMGQTSSVYQYGPVTDYSIKTFMSNTAGRGFTWGVAGAKPIAGLEVTTGNMTIAGAFAAASKSFLIPHPTKEGWKLRYGSLEGPENGVYIRGKLKGKNKIELPEYWTKLVDPDSITVTLTPIGKHQKLYVEDITNNVVTVANDGLFAGEINCFFVVYGERIDIDKLVVEYE